MKPQDNTPHELDLLRENPASDPDASVEPSRLPRNLTIGFTVLILVLVVAFFSARIWARHAMRDSLPQLDGSIAIPGLSAPVTVQRDQHGVPHIRAASMDDLIIAQATSPHRTASGRWRSSAATALAPWPSSSAPLLSPTTASTHPPASRCGRSCCCSP